MTDFTKKTFSVAAGKCLFDSTTWDPMTQEEWVTWSRDVWVKFTQMGHTAFRTHQAKQAAFAKQIAYDLLVYGSAVVHVDKTFPDNVVAARVDPTLVSEGPLVPFKFDTKKKW